MAKPPSPRVFEEAERWFRERVPMGASQRAALDRRSRERAFALAGIESEAIATKVRDAIARAVRDGTGLADFKREVGGMLARAWGSEVNVGARLELVFTNAVQSAYNHSRHRVLSSPSVKALRPFWRFENPMDERTSAICRARHGKVLSADDPWWRDNVPPLHHACRSSIKALTAKQAEREGITGAPRGAPPPDGDFGRAPR